MADNTINGTSGDDTLSTPNSTQTNVVYGGDGNDTLIDGSIFDGADTFFGGAGDDNITGASGNDVADGGVGNDTITASGGDDTIIVSDNFGTDFLFGGDFEETLGDTLDASAMTTAATLTFGAELTPITGGGPGDGGDPPPDGGGDPPPDGGDPPPDFGDPPPDFGDPPPDGGDPPPDGGDPLPFGGESGDLPTDGEEGGDPGGLPGGGTGPGDEEPGGGPGTGSGTTTGVTLESGVGNFAEIAEIEFFLLGSGSDTVIDDAGDNTVNMGGGDDQFIVTDFFGADSVTGGEGNETIGDLIDGGALTSNITVTFSSDGEGVFTDGIETVTFAEIERIETGLGADTIYGGTGAESIDGNAGDDTFFFADNFGNDIYVGGEAAETVGDRLDGSALTAGVTIVYTGDTATLTDGVSNASFSEIETVILGAGDDTVTGDTGNESISTGAGADTFAINDAFGTDVVDLGTGIDDIDGSNLTTVATITFSADGIGTITAGANTVSFEGAESVSSGSGDDSFVSTSLNETIGTNAGDDTFTLVDNFGTDAWDAGEGGETTGDRLDATGLTGDSTVSLNNDGSGSLTNGTSSIAFQDVEQIDAGAGNDTITVSTNAETIQANGGDDHLILSDNFGADSYDGGSTGETNGDKLDGSALTSGVTVTLSDQETGTISDGVDTASFADFEDISTGSGDDTIVGSTGDDSIATNEGDDAFVLADGFGSDTIAFGENGETYGDLLDSIALTDDVSVTFTGNEQGSLLAGTDAATFSDVERIRTGAGNDTIVSGSGNNNVSTNAGDDTFIVTDGFGTDTFDAGNDQDRLDGSGLTADAIVVLSGGGAGTLTQGANAISFAGVEEVSTGAGSDTITGSSDNDTIDAGAGNDRIVLDTDFGTDDIDGGGDTDVVDASGLTSDIAVSLTNGSGTLIDGVNVASLTNIEGVNTGSGNDTAAGSAANETFDLGAGNDEFVIGDNFGSDSFSAGSGTDKIDASAVTADTTIDLNAETFHSGGNSLNFDSVEELETGTGDDQITGSDSNESINANDGDDTFIIADNFGNDTFNAGAGNESTGDTLDASALTTAATVNFESVENGTLTSGSNSVAYTEVEKVITGSGDDTFVGTAGAETITANGGDDRLTITDGFGSDQFDAGETGETSGDTVIVDIADDVAVDFAGTLTSGSDTLTFSGVENITTNDGNDSFIGSSNDETVNAGRGDDTFTVNDNWGNDTFNAGEGLITGGDTIDASAVTRNLTVDFSADENGTITSGGNTLAFTDVENIITGAGNDNLTGSNASENFVTGDGNDRIEGNGGADTIFAGAGADRIFIAEGDSVQAGAGDDIFQFDNTGETNNATITIDGGSEDTAAGDTLRLGPLVDVSTLSTTTDASGSYSGSVELINGTTVNFTDIETIVICFTPGTMIATPHGPRDIARLRVGDMVRTRDNGPQPIRWIQKRTVPAIDNFAPIRIRPSVIPGLTQDLLVSPQHRMLLEGYRAELLYGDREVLVSATHLVDGKDVTQDAGGEVTYIHMMFEQHEIVYANGAASESFHPGTVGLNGVTDAARDELFRLFPELRSNPNGYGRTARRCLRKHETRLLSV